MFFFYWKKEGYYMTNTVINSIYIEYYRKNYGGSMLYMKRRLEMIERRLKKCRLFLSEKERKKIEKLQEEREMINSIEKYFNKRGNI